MKRIWVPRVLLTFTVFLAACLPCFSDGLDSWQKVSTSPYGSFNAITCGNGVFVASSINAQYPYLTNQGGISFSTDGRNWTHFSNDNWPSGAAFGNGTFVVSAQDSFSDGDAGWIYYSTDGSNWTVTRNVDTVGLRALTFGKGIFVAAGYYYEYSQGLVYTSTDGVNWATQTTGTTNMLNGIAWGNNWFLAVASPNSSYGPVTNGTVLRSGDATNWTILPAAANPFTGVLSDLRFVNGNFYVKETIYRYPNPNVVNIYSSAAGFSWTKLTTPEPSLWLSTAETNNLYLSVGTNGGVFTSADATSWLARNSGFTNDLNCVAFGNNVFVAAGSAGGIFLSGSALPSLLGRAQSPGGVFQITVTNGLGPAYRLEASTDFSGWTNLYTFTNIQTGNQYLDLSASNYARRFYRAVWP